MRTHYATNRKRCCERRAKEFANKRAAKERRRMERVAADWVAPDASHAIPPKRVPALFTVTIRCRDGESVSLRIHETPFGLTTSATLAGQKVACILANYRPA